MNDNPNIFRRTWDAIRNRKPAQQRATNKMQFYGAPTSATAIPNAVVQLLPSDANGFVPDVRGNSLGGSTWVRSHYYAEEVQTNVVVSACVSRRVEMVSKAVFGAYVMKGKDASVYDPMHKASQLLNTPYEGGSQTKLFSLIEYFCSVGGYCVLEKVRDKNNGSLIGLKPHSPEFIAAYVVGGMIVAWEYYDGSLKRQQLLPDDVIVIPSGIINPSCPALSLSWIAPIYADARAMTAATQYTGDVLNHGGIPPIAVIYEEDISQDREAIQQMLENAGLNQNQGSVIPLGMNAKIHQLGISPADARLLEIADSAETHICSAAGVPPIIAGTRAGLAAMTYSNYISARKEFLNSVIIPRVAMIAQALTEGLQGEYIGMYTIEADLSGYNEIDTTNIDSQKVMLSAYERQALSREELRTSFGYDSKIADGETMYEPVQGVTPMSSSSRAAVQQRMDMPDDFVSFEMDDSPTAIQWRSINNLVAPIEQELSTNIGRAFVNFGDTFISTIGQRTESNDGNVQTRTEPSLKKVMDAFDVEELANALSGAAEPSVRKLIRKMWERSLKDIGSNPDDKGETAYDRFFRRALQRSLDKIKESADTAEREVRDAVQKIVRDNYDKAPDEIEQAIRDRLKDKFQTLGDSRAAVIAQTSATFTATNTQKTVWADAGIKSKWASQRGSRVRDAHRAADGQVENENGMFIVGGEELEHPGSGGSAKNCCNCQCYLIPVME